jgi:hypothetical protein
MTFDIFDLLEKGFTTFVAVLAVTSVVGIIRIITKHIPQLLNLGRDFIKVWQDFVSAVDTNAKAVEDNTEITDAHYKHSEIVLRELQEVSSKFKRHDENALLIKESIEELIELVKNADDKEEMLILLRRIINKLEDES